MLSSGFYRDLYRWFDSCHRVLPWRETTDAYAIWLSEIILQQTRVNQGMEYYLRFMETWPTIRDLANANEDEVLRMWQGLGYYSRARNLHKAAKWVVEHADNDSCDIFPKEFADIKALPGVGDYTAGAISSFAYNLPYPALDGNVYRVLSRLFDCDIPFDTTIGKKHFRQLAVQLLDCDNPRLFNTAIMEFGALYCTPVHPDCDECPIRAYCRANANHTAELLPVRKPRPQVKDRFMGYTLYISKDKQTLIHQRSEKDIWQHLWEFVLDYDSDQPPIADNSSNNSMLVRFDHVLSHRKIHAQFRCVAIDNLPEIDGAKVVGISDLNDYAFPKLTLRALDYFAPILNK